MKIRKPAHDVVLEKLQESLKSINEACILEDDLKLASYSGRTEVLLNVINEMKIPESVHDDFITKLRAMQVFCKKCKQQKNFFDITQKYMEKLIKEV